jgi:hypothetical protein
VVEGRRTYEIGLAAGLTDACPHLRHIVFSRTLVTIGAGVPLSGRRIGFDPRAWSLAGHTALPGGTVVLTSQRGDTPPVSGG